MRAIIQDMQQDGNGKQPARYAAHIQIEIYRNGFSFGHTPKQAFIRAYGKARLSIRHKDFMQSMIDCHNDKFDHRFGDI